MAYLPINLNLTDRLVLVVGGGFIALQKVRVLAAAGARVRLVAPVVHPDIEAGPNLEIRRRRFLEDDLSGVGLVIAATDEELLNRRVRELAHARGLLVNVVDVPGLCDFIFPSVLRRDDLAISVSTSGTSPSFARMLREQLEEEIDPRLGELLALMASLRARGRRELVCAGARRAAAETLAAMALSGRREIGPGLAARMEALLDELISLGERESRDHPSPDPAEIQWTS